ncbi:MAG: cytochrome P450 [Actinobacteria bacterium]|nr:cytochrome P450 [Actinomycetota bacterium]
MTAPTTDRLAVPDEIARAVMLPSSYADLEGTVFPACDWLRRNLPVGLAQIDGYDPVWLLARHGDIKEALRDADLFHNADANIMLQPMAGDEYLRGMLDGTTKVLRNLSYMEPPEHTEYRRALKPVFEPGAVLKYADRFRRIARDAVDRLLDHDGECDFVATLSMQYPLTAVMETIGVPHEDYRKMLRWTQDTFGGDDPDWKRDEVETSPEAMAKQWHAAVQDFYEYFEVMRSDRLAQPNGDMTSDIVNSHTSSGELLPDIVQNHMAASIAIAGHDTTNSALSAGMLGLIRFPEQLERVRTDLSLAPGLVDESLRYATPAKHFMRNATRDVEFQGAPIKAMDRVMALFVSGNRDESVFPDPYRFDVTRRPNPHLSFSYGPHICLGLHMAKLEMRVLFEELLPRIGKVELAGEPRLKQSSFVSGLKSLPIRFTKA